MPESTATNVTPLPGLSAIFRASPATPGGKVRNAAELMGYAWNDFLDLLGVTRAHFSYVFRDQRPSRALIVRVCKILGVLPSDINPAWPDAWLTEEDD